jgi:hypothetical protein
MAKLLVEKDVGGLGGVYKSLTGKESFEKTLKNKGL